MAKSPATFSSSSTCAFSAVSHICSIVIDRDWRESFAGSAHGRIDDPLKQHRVCVEISGSAMLSDIAVRTISPTVMRRRSAPAHSRLAARARP